MCVCVCVCVCLCGLNIVQWIFFGGKIFVVFMVERRAVKFLPMKQYRIVPGCGLVYHDHKNFFHELAKNSLLTKIYPPKNTRYTVTKSGERILNSSIYICSTYGVILRIAKAGCHLVAIAQVVEH